MPIVHRINSINCDNTLLNKPLGSSAKFVCSIDFGGVGEAPTLSIEAKWKKVFLIISIIVLINYSFMTTLGSITILLPTLRL